MSSKFVFSAAICKYFILETAGGCTKTRSIYQPIIYDALYQNKKDLEGQVD